MVCLKTYYSGFITIFQRFTVMNIRVPTNLNASNSNQNLPILCYRQNAFKEVPGLGLYSQQITDRPLVTYFLEKYVLSSTLLSHTFKRKFDST